MLHLHSNKTLTKTLFIQVPRIYAEGGEIYKKKKKKTKVMNDSKETVSSKHNRVDPHVMSHIVADCIRTHRLKLDKYFRKKKEEIPPS